MDLRKQLINGFLSGKKLVLPNYDYDFASMGNGALPDPLTGSTYAISGGKAINTPTLGTELFTDGSLEATYTDGLCTTLTKAGTPTVAESADAHDGSKAQQFVGALNSDVHNNFTSTSGKWFYLSGYVKRTSGTNNKTNLRKSFNAFPGNFSSQRAIKDAAYTQKVLVFKSYASSLQVNCAFESVASGNGDTVIVDKFSLKEIPHGEMFAATTYDSADGTARAHINLENGNGIAGVVARLDNVANPQNYLIASVHTNNTSNGVEFGYVSLAKVVGGTLTELIAPVALAELVLNNDYIEIECSGTSVILKYNGVQKGTTKTVTDAGIVGNKLFGFYGVGGGSVSHFLLGQSLSSTFTGANHVVDSTQIVEQTASKWSGRPVLEFNSDGELVLIYRKGANHSSTDSILHIRFSDDYGTTWSDEDKDLLGNAITGFPYDPIAFEGTDTPQEPYLYVAPNGNLILHTWQPSTGTWQSTSTDGGKTWDAGAPLSISGHDGVKLFATDDHFVYDGVIYAAARDFEARPHYMLLMKSIDNGATWTFIADMCPADEDMEAVEVGIEYLGNNRIIAIYRTLSGDSTARSYSEDMGATWSQLEAITYNIPGSGRHRIMTWKHLKGEANWWNDTNLVMCGYIKGVNVRTTVMWYSADAGETWSPSRPVDSAYEDGGYADFVWNPVTQQIVLMSYLGEYQTAVAIVKQYNLTVTW